MSEQANTPVKTLIQEGDKTNYPPVGSMIEMHYSGYLYDPSKPDNKGNKSVFHCYAAHLGALHLKKKSLTNSSPTGSTALTTVALPLPARLALAASSRVRFLHQFLEIFTIQECSKGGF